MTHVIKADNVNDALLIALWWLDTAGHTSDSRNGRVLVSPTPVITEYARPERRVLFHRLRDANPFFHFFESLWMLAGRDDVAFPAHFAANIASFSDDGVTVAGAYGKRWRQRFGYDQLTMIIAELKANPDSRRCVLSMWDAGGGCNAGDLHLAMNGGKDVPCNTQVYFDTLGGKLNMTVTCRSNDAIWGCYGANMVHFSMLLEYVALSTDIPMGVYRQFSNNFHVYIDRPDVQRLYSAHGPTRISSDDRYYSDGLITTPLMPSGRPQCFDADLEQFFFAADRSISNVLISNVLGAGNFASEFFRCVVVPLWNAHVAYKRNNFVGAHDAVARCAADDWKLACLEWLYRREEKRNAKAES